MFELVADALFLFSLYHCAGEGDGDAEGDSLGLTLGDGDGEAEGLTLGETLGEIEGLSDAILHESYWGH